MKGYAAGGGAFVLCLLAGTTVWWKHAAAEDDRHLERDPAIAICQNAIRDEVRDDLRHKNLSDSDETTIVASARFSAVNGTPEALSADNYGVPDLLGRSRSAVLTNWQISGHLSLDGPIPFASGLESENRFMCSVVVFDDKTIYVATTQIVQG